MAILWACEMTRQVSGTPRIGNCSRATCTASRSGTCSASSTLKYCRKRKILSSLRRFSVSSCTQPPARSCSSWDSFSVRSTGAPPKASCTAGSCRKSPSRKPDPAVRGELGDVGLQPDVELRDLLDHQPVQRAAPRADGPAHPVVRRLRPQPEVLDAAVRLGDQGDPFAELRELRHDLPSPGASSPCPACRTTRGCGR